MLKIIDFWGLKGKFDVKRGKFRGVIAKIGCLRPILASRNHLRPIFMVHVIKNVSYVVWGSRVLKVSF